jgi:hypothetical protein
LCTKVRIYYGTQRVTIDKNILKMVDTINPRAESNWAKSEKVESRSRMELPRELRA